jgi:hypothetical protein
LSHPANLGPFPCSANESIAELLQRGTFEQFG